MDRETFAANARKAYSSLVALRAAWLKYEPVETHAWAVETIDGLIACEEHNARIVLGPSFRFEPDPARVTDATPARMSALRPVPSASRPALSVVAGGQPERPLLTQPAAAIDPNCACFECVRARSEGRRPNVMQHFGYVGRPHPERAPFDLREPSEPRQIYSCVPSQPADANRTRPSDRYVDEPEAG